jgi:hypothetical protein
LKVGIEAELELDLDFGTSTFLASLASTRDLLRVVSVVVVGDADFCSQPDLMELNFPSIEVLGLEGSKLLLQM